MNTPVLPTLGSGVTRAAALEARFALRLTARLTERNAALPHDITERLRVARALAVAQARRPSLAMAAAPAGVRMGGVGGSQAILGGSGGERWSWLGGALPALALLIGLFGIAEWHQREQIVATADIDAALLLDDLPPAAYADPGFAEYLSEPLTLGVADEADMPPPSLTPVSP